MIQAKEIKLVKLKDIKLNPNNRNKHPDEQIDRIVDIIKYQGFRRPGTISNRSGLLVCGEGRYLAAKKLGLKEMPIMFQDYESEEQEYADGIADNALDKWAALDLSEINNDLLNFSDDFDVDVLGLKDFETVLPEVFEPQADEDEVPEQVDTRCKLGDVWTLGRHRLMCGDSTSIDAVENLIREPVELCFTSPPYADQRDYNGDKELSTEHLATFIRAAYSKVKYFAVNLGYSRKDGEVSTYWDDYISEAKNCGLKFLSWNIWDKGECGSIGNQTAMFGISHEWIFVFGPERKELNLTVPNKSAGERVNHTGNRQSDGTIKKSKNRIVRDASQLRTVYSLSAQKARDEINHPARFPVEFPEGYIEALTDENQCVYEPFGGSGSTLIACEKTNRKCFMMELDPHYCDVILSRWEKYTGKIAERIGG